MVSPTLRDQLPADATSSSRESSGQPTVRGWDVDTFSFCCCGCREARLNRVAVKSPEQHDARACLSPDHLDHNVGARSSRCSTVRRQLSDLPAEVGVGRFKLYFVLVPFVGSVPSDRCGPFRHVPGEPSRTTAVPTTTVSSRPRSAFPIDAIAAAAIARGAFASRQERCRVMPGWCLLSRRQFASDIRRPAPAVRLK